MALSSAPAAAAPSGVYDRYFVTGSAGAGAPGDGRSGQYECNSGQFGGTVASLTGCGVNTQPGWGRVAGATDYVGTTDTSGRSRSIVVGTTAYEFHYEYDSAGKQITVRDPGYSSALASADLKTASLHASVTNNAHGGFVGGDARVDLHDILNFHVAGASASTHTRVLFQFSIDGKVRNDGQTTIYGESGGGGLLAALHLDNPAALSSPSAYSLDASTGWNADHAAFSLLTPTVDNRGGATVGGRWTTNSFELMVFEGFFDIIGSDLTLNPTLSLALNCSIGLQCDYNDTAKFSFVGLPSSVSYTSDSGVFLATSAVTPLPAVPEPGTYALMLAGLGLVGWFARRRLPTTG